MAISISVSEFITIIIGFSSLFIGCAAYLVFDFARGVKSELNAIRSTIEVRVDELEKRIIAISGANFSKIRRVESQCDLNSARFEFFDQMFREYIAKISANPPAHNA
jgi:hypothetical protein